MMWHRLFVRTAFAVSLGTLPLCAQAAERYSKTMALQVMLDRAGFSPGVIEGNMGRLTRQALRGFQEAKGIKVTGRLDAEARAILGEQAEATEIVKVTEADASGPFLTKIPESMAEQAKLEGLYYTSI